MHLKSSQNELLLKGLLFSIAVLSTDLSIAAPGDLQLTIMADDEDLNDGPDGNEISRFIVLPTADTAPVSIDDSGFISFSADVVTENGIERGFYHARAPGVISTILQTDQVAPGITQDDASEPNGFRNLELDQGRGFAASLDGQSHAITVFTRFDGPFLYGASGGTVHETPTTWPALLSPTRNFWEAVEMSDGRGNTETLSGGTGPNMVVSNTGAIFWQKNNTILRSRFPGDLSAVMITDTPAPGFDAAEEAMLDAPFSFRGIDGANNAVFFCKVNKTSGSANAAYRQNSNDNSLTLLFIEGVASLPAGPGLEAQSAQVQEEDIWVSQNGAIFLRGRVSTSLGGFWKITVDSEGTVTTELLGLFSSNGFNPTITDEGQVDFRNIHLADWAVTENGTVFFSADVAGSGGEPTSAMEGVWKIDPTDLSVTTVARFGQNADPGGSDATYKIFSDVTAAGDDKVAFIAELSDGNRGLFSTDLNGGVIRIAIEGSPLIPCENAEDTLLECQTIASIHFTPDHAGEDLLISKGSPGLNSFGELAFLATFAGGDTALVKASYEGAERATGTDYIWDAGLSSGTDWHEIVDGKTNWVDLNGTRWHKAPTTPNAEVTIPENFTVELTQSVTEIRTLDSQGTLELNANLTVRETTKLGDVTIKGDNELISNGEVIVDGDVNAGVDGIRTISTELDHFITTEGNISGLGSGIRSNATNAVTINNDAMVFGNTGPGIWVESQSGTVFVENRGLVSSSNGSGILVTALDGQAIIQSPGISEGLGDTRISSVDDHGIRVAASDAARVEFAGQINTISNAVFNSAYGIDASSTGSDTTVVARGEISSTGVSAIGIHAQSAGNTTVDFEGQILSAGIGILASTTGETLTIDARVSDIAADLGGIQATGGSGLTSIHNGTIDSTYTAIGVEAPGDISVTSNGAITVTASDSPSVGTDGIRAVSADGGVSITNTNDISLTTESSSSAIFAQADKDITLTSSGNLSTFRGTTISLETEPGVSLLESIGSNIEATHMGNVDSSEGGAGLDLTSNGGSITLRGPGSNDSVSTSGIGEDASGIRALGLGDVSIDWSGRIETAGDGAHGIMARSALGEVSIEFLGEMESVGQDSDGVRLEGGADLSLAISDGSISGGESAGAGVRFIGGANNILVNFGEIQSLGGNAIEGGDGDETIENFSKIYGNVNLGGGANTIENSLDSLFFSDETINLGAGNRLLNDSVLQLGETGEPPISTVLTGDFAQTASGTLRTRINASKENSRLVVSGDTTLAGTLEIKYETGSQPVDGDSFVVLQSGTLSGNFRRIALSQNGFSSVSRFHRFSLTQENVSVRVDVTTFTVTDYEGWQNRFFTPEQVADDSISNPSADPDGDGLSNLFEYVFGTDPLVADQPQFLLTITPTAVSNEAIATLTFPWVNDLTDYTWAIYYSHDLSIWTRASTTLRDSVSEGDYSRLTVELDEPVNTDLAVFARLVLISTP